MSRLVYHDAAERERMYDLLERMRLPFGLALGVLIFPAIAAVPVYGWACELPLVLAVLGYGINEHRMRRLRHPERWTIATWAFAELMILLMIALAQGPRQYLLAVPVVPMVGVMMVMGRRIALACASGLALGVCTVAALTMWDEVAASPPVLIAPIALIFAGVLVSMGALDGTFVSRRTEAIDPLTGLLNRVALQTRTTELAAQASVAGERVALIVVELDGFRAIRAEHGAATADAVLAEAGRRLRTEAGSGIVSRFDGATFVVLCPGATRVAAIANADRLRDAVAASPIDDVAVTASLGISVYRGGTFDFAELFARGVAAASAARDRGGDGICLAPDDTIAVLPAGELPAATALRADDEWSKRLEAATDRSPLMRNAIDRAHAVDSLARTQPLVRAAAVVLGLALALNAIWAGWIILLPGVVGVVAWEVLARWAPRSRRPEYPAFAGLAMIILTSGASAALAGPIGLFMVPTVAVVVLGACSGFPRVGAALLGALGFAVTAAVVLAVGAGEIAANPVILVLPLAYVVGFAVMGETMGRGARDHRVTAITDEATGMLNYAALDARIPALEQLAVDHAIGIVLLAVAPEDEEAAAGRLLVAQAAFAPAYRLGGGEFVALTTGAERALTRTAERLASAVRATAVGTASVPAGDVCSFDVLMAEATASQRETARRDGTAAA